MELVEKTIPVKIGSRTFLKLIAPVASLFVESQWVVEFNFPLFRGLHFLGTTCTFNHHISTFKQVS
jgi:hypothetical protein